MLNCLDHDNVVDALVECNVNINMKDQSGKTALHVAIDSGELFFTQFENNILINRDSFVEQLVNLQTKIVGSKRMVECLINNSANVNLKDGQGNSPLMLALKKGEVF